MRWTTGAFIGLAPDQLVLTEHGYWRAAQPPTEDELKAYYTERYYQEGRGSYETTYNAEELRHIRGKIALRWAQIAPRFTAPGSLLDVGCGEGFVLDHAAAVGWTVRGIDFSAAGLEAQNPHCRPALETGDVFDILRRDIEAGASYHVIWLQNVLEHVTDPEVLLRDLKALVAPGGALVVTVPNDFSRLQHEALLTGRIDRPFWVALPDHLSYFTADGLKNIGRLTGWACESLLGDFPVDWFLFNHHSNYIADRSKGKAAHRARIALENLILESNPADAAAFFAAIAQVGMGRDLTAIFSPLEEA